MILFSGSKTTGGFIVSAERLVQGSVFPTALAHLPGLAGRRVGEGLTARFHGRWTCWIGLRSGGLLPLSGEALAAYGLTGGDALLVIRGSNVGFVMGARGPFVDLARQHPEIPTFP
ncbi:MAG: hypothetical protein GX605_10685 [Chloroflexi bacterium]|nr:hypothetical protein [Chloroflexota bacterium]